MGSGAKPPPEPPPQAESAAAVTASMAVGMILEMCIVALE